MDNPLFTVIVAVFNGADTLQQCIDSVLAQSYANTELIIIDGGSTDGTVEILETNKPHLTYMVSEPDHGIYNAWNKGLRHSSGEWICFLGADDFFWNPSVLERLSEKLAKVHQSDQVVYGQIMLLTPDGNPLYPVGEPWPDIKLRFKDVMCIPHTAVLHRRTLFESVGSFDESFRIAGDYELLLRWLKEHDAVHIPGLIVSGMRIGGVSSNPSSSLKTMHEIRRAQRMHGDRWPGRGWVLAMGRVRLRQCIWHLLGERCTRRLLDLSRRLRGLEPYWTKI